MAKQSASKWIILVLTAILMISISLSCTSNQYAVAPTFTLFDNTGHKVSLTDYKGQKAVLLLFFNYKIGTGQDPTLQSYLNTYNGMARLQTFCVVNVAAVPEQGKQFMAGHQQSNPGGLGFATPLQDQDGSVSQIFGANPDKLTLVLLDRDQRIRFRQEGVSPADNNTVLAEQIQALTK
jgi:hypothetical protein